MYIFSHFLFVYWGSVQKYQVWPGKLFISLNQWEGFFGFRKHYFACFWEMCFNRQKEKPKGWGSRESQCLALKGICLADSVMTSCMLKSSELSRDKNGAAPPPGRPSFTLVEAILTDIYKISSLSGGKPHIDKVPWQHGRRTDVLYIHFPSLEILFWEMIFILRKLAWLSLNNITDL